MGSLDREISIYYMMLLVIPVAGGAMVLTAIIIVIEWGIRLGTGRSASFSDLRSIAEEVSIYVFGGTLIGGGMSIIGLLPGLSIAWLVIRDASMLMFKLGSSFATLVGSLATLFLFRKEFRRKSLPDKSKEYKINDWRAIPGLMLGFFWPVISVSILLRYPY